MKKLLDDVAVELLADELHVVVRDAVGVDVAAALHVAKLAQLGVAILVRVLFTYVFSGLSGFIDIVSIFGTIAVALLLTKKNVWLKNE